MRWGVFEQEDGPHVCPSDADGFALYPHTLRQTCECRPTIKYLGWKRCNLIVHHDGH